MQEFIKCFTRDSSGAWTCISKADFKGPNGRIQVAVGSRFTPGTIFMGVDLAHWFDQELRRDGAMRSSVMRDSRDANLGPGC